MFGIANYAFIIFGLLLIGGALLDYKVLNHLIWGKKSNWTGIFKKISPAMFKLNKLGDYWDGLLGVILCLIGLYGLMNDIHKKDDIELSDMMHEIFHKDKKDKDNKEESAEY